MNKSEILKRITEEQIFEKYIGPVRIGKMIRSPLRKDNTPSFHIFINKNQNLMFKDFGSGEYGDCFKFIQLMFRKDFAGALRIIEEDFNLIGKSYTPVKRKPNIYDILPKYKEEKKSKFEWNEKSFSSEELKYWRRFGITHSILMEYDVISIENVKEVNWKNQVISTPNCPIFAYKYPSGAIRFYRPLAFDKKHFGNSGVSDVFGYKQAYKEMYENKQKLSRLAISAGQKDSLSLYANTSIRTIALNSESAILSKELFSKLQEIAENIVVCYDLDKTGRTNSEKLCNGYGLQDIMIDFPIKTGKDISDYFYQANKEKLVTF